MGKSQKNYMSIKSKLMAAVAMLLVASFMVVSSTYAWFTLSTAPEIKGIRTTIGANGSLEIALAEGNSKNPFNKEAVKTGVGTSGDYTTWGNLIDASDAKYGMDKIVLLPSRLYIPTSNVTIDDSGETPVVSVNEYLATSPLSTPIYGADGRISALEANTVYGIYDGTSQFVSDDDASGLRAIGNASGMTKQQSTYRQAKQDVTTYLSAAQAKAVASLQTNGNDLATVIAAYATTSGDDSTYDITCVGNIVTALTAANKDIEQAIRSYFKAVMASKMGDKDETVFTTALNAFDALSTEDLIAGGAKVGEYTLPAVSEFDAAISAVCAKWTAINKALNDETTGAATALGKVADHKAASGNDLAAVLITSGLMNIDGVKINGLTKDEIRAYGGLGKLLNAYMDAGAFYVQLPKGSGVYADIAEVTGNYQARVTIKELAYGDIKAEDVPATMITTVETTINLKAQIPEAPAAVSGGNAAITDFYGYAIDLVFRTNAKDSNLMLQTTPEQRIYSDSTNQQTLGSGSKMIFTSGDDNFTSAQMKELMSAIRIVFTTKDDLGTKIVAIAGLDVDNAVATAEGGYEVSVKLLDYSWKVDFAQDGSSVTGIVLNIKDENKFKANEIKEKVTGEDGTVTETESTTKFAQTLMALNQNEATVLTAMVYLDGDYVDNADVATNGTSMMGTLSLQFSSDAELTPMMNTPVFEGTEQGGTTAAPATPEETTQGN